MKKAFLFLWLLFPVAAGAYHYGPGQDQVRLDAAARAIERGQGAAHEARTVAADKGDEAAREHWVEAEAALREALSLVPAERVEDVRALRIEHVKAQMFVGQLAEAHATLHALVDELDQDAAASPTMRNEARRSLANAQYFSTWLMRLEGAPREEWEREIEASRQNYRLVAEEAQAGGDEQLAAKAGEDLEAAIRLARMDTSELQGLPLPSQCKNCSSCKSGKCNGKKPGKKPGKSPKKDARGAGSGPPPDGAGS